MVPDEGRTHRHSASRAREDHGASSVLGPGSLRQYPRCPPAQSSDGAGPGILSSTCEGFQPKRSSNMHAFCIRPECAPGSRSQLRSHNFSRSIQFGSDIGTGLHQDCAHRSRVLPGTVPPDRAPCVSRRNAQSTYSESLQRGGAIGALYRPSEMPPCRMASARIVAFRGAGPQPRCGAPGAEPRHQFWKFGRAAPLHRPAACSYAVQPGVHPFWESTSSAIWIWRGVKRFLRSPQA